MTWVTVRDLYAMLAELDPDAIILLASDEEGNSVRSLYEVGATGMYYPEGNEFYMNEDPYEVGSEPAHLIKAVVLWP